MGLQEKRAIEAARSGWLPKRQDELDGICGGSVPYEVDWTSFEGNAKAIEWLEHNGPQQVAAAFRGVCRDELGKEAIREGVKKVVLRNVEAAEDKTLAFADGVLTLTCAFAKSPGGRFNDREIRTLLESGL